MFIFICRLYNHNVNCQLNICIITVFVFYAETNANDNKRWGPVAVIQCRPAPKVVTDIKTVCSSKENTTSQHLEPCGNRRINPILLPSVRFGVLTIRPERQCLDRERVGVSLVEWILPFSLENRALRKQTSVRGWRSSSDWEPSAGG